MTSPNEPAVSLLQIIQDKYSDEDLDQEFVHIKITKKKTASSVPGMLPIPQCLALNYMNISCPGDDAELSQLCCRVRELDVAQNKFTSWEDVFSMLKCMGSLHFVNLSSNLLDHSVNYDNNQVFSNITHLILNNTQIAWSTVESLLLNTFTCLEELHLSLNNYSVINNDNAHTYPSLKTLHINGNKFTDFTEVCKIGSMFPNLQTLVMAENQIETLPSEAEIAASLCNIQCLSISKNLIKEWSELEKLNYFPKLIDVKLLGIPLLEDYNEKIRRQFVIAVLPERILRLNGSTILIKNDEREDAERAFIRYYMEKDIKPSKFDELEAKHGKLDALVEVDLTLPDPTVKVILEPEEDDVALTRKETIMQISEKQTVGELKKHLVKFAGIPAKSMRLFYKGADSHFEELKFPSLTIRNVGDGDEFLIIPKH
ncbi:unnamed protein product [Owenia fusiformis]|uniref:Uncharacterized protein n=1 Tax=Owenia fusiformis TaxID=6347 RepID=A0A8J1XSB3_OWEFU|nr:unnamed protein product [Owenia fusiformis]